MDGKMLLKRVVGWRAFLAGWSRDVDGGMGCGGERCGVWGVERGVGCGGG